LPAAASARGRRRRVRCFGLLGSGPLPSPFVAAATDLWKFSRAAGVATMLGVRGGVPVLELFVRRGVVSSSDGAELLR
jgi:hypothetical protein